MGKWPRINTVSLGENSFGQKQDETVFMEYLILKPVPKQVSERRFAQCQPVGIEGCCPEMMLIQLYKKSFSSPSEPNSQNSVICQLLLTKF